LSNPTPEQLEKKYAESANPAKRARMGEKQKDPDSPRPALLKWYDKPFISCPPVGTLVALEAQEGKYQGRVMRRGEIALARRAGRGWQILYQKLSHGSLKDYWQPLGKKPPPGATRWDVFPINSGKEKGWYIRDVISPNLEQESKTAAQAAVGVTWDASIRQDRSPALRAKKDRWTLSIQHASVREAKCNQPYDSMVIVPTDCSQGLRATTTQARNEPRTTVTVYDPPYEVRAKDEQNRSRLEASWKAVVWFVMDTEPMEVITEGLGRHFPPTLAAEVMLAQLEPLRKCPLKVTVCCESASWFKAVMSQMAERQSGRVAKRR
jgi:hypothetical protein